MSEVFYLAHVRFENGEEFGLYRERADADGHVAWRASEPGVRLAEVLSLAVIEPDRAAVRGQLEAVPGE